MQAALQAERAVTFAADAAEQEGERNGNHYEEQYHQGTSEWTSGESNPGPTNLSLSFYERVQAFSRWPTGSVRAPPAVLLGATSFRYPPPAWLGFARGQAPESCPGCLRSHRERTRLAPLREHEDPSLRCGSCGFPLSEPAGLSLATSVPVRRRNLSGPELVAVPDLRHEGKRRIRLWWPSRQQTSSGLPMLLVRSAAPSVVGLAGRLGPALSGPVAGAA